MIWAMAGLCSAGAGCAGAQAPNDSHAASQPAPAGSHAASQPAPVFTRTVVLAPVGGKVLIDVPGGSRRFAPLGARRSVPVGTVLDATAGRVSLTSANPPQPGGVQTGEFFRGIFRVEQPDTAGGLVDLVMRDNLARKVCASGAARSAALSARVLGLLRGVAKGRFRTTGRFAAATVRGTDWGVRDRCDGTLTVVRRGVVVVHDFRLHKNIVVRAGHTYLATAP